MVLELLKGINNNTTDPRHVNPEFFEEFGLESQISKHSLEFLLLD